MSMSVRNNNLAMSVKMPNNEMAEKSVLGSMLLYPEAVALALGSLTMDDFYVGNRPNQIVFEAITNVHNQKSSVDIQTVYNELVNMKEIEKVGGIDYLKELADSSFGYTNLEHYIKILQDHTVLRAFLSTMEDVLDEYSTRQIEDISEFVAIGSDRIARVAEKRRISDFRSTKQITKIISETLATMKASGDNHLTGVTTGYPRLNEYTHGFQPGNMIIIAARPSVGKTALAINMAMNAAERDNKTAAIFSIEMPAEQLVLRLIANKSNVDLGKIQTNSLSSTEQAKVGAAINTIASLPLFIDDTPGIRLLDIVAKSKKLKAAHEDLSLIVIDYIGLITTGKDSVESRQLEVSEISRTLKELARELKIPVVVLSQLSREVEKRPNKRPMLSDLRESGSIEQDADVVLMLYRDDYYTKTGQKGTPSAKYGESREDAERRNAKQKEDMEKNGSENGDYSMVEVIIGKNRNGKTGVVPLIFFKSYGRFDTPTQNFEQEYMGAGQQQYDE